MSTDLDEAMALATNVSRADERAARQRWVRERIERKSAPLPYDCGYGDKGTVTDQWYRCPDCQDWELGRYALWLNHGWDWEGCAPFLACCHRQLSARHRSFPPFAASQQAQGCGPLREPWTVEKRMYVHEVYLHDLEVQAWRKATSFTRDVREVPSCFRL